jgi:hypothetical protein
LSKLVASLQRKDGKEKLDMQNGMLQLSGDVFQIFHSNAKRENSVPPLAVVKRV